MGCVRGCISGQTFGLDLLFRLKRTVKLRFTLGCILSICVRRLGSIYPWQNLAYTQKSSPRPEDRTRKQIPKLKSNQSWAGRSRSPKGSKGCPEEVASRKVLCAGAPGRKRPKNKNVTHSRHVGLFFVIRAEV